MPILRGAFALAALAVLAPNAHAFLILDDFTVGGFTRRLERFGTYTYEESGLDRAHSAWGHRALRTEINSNPNNTYLDVTVGGGVQRFESPVPVMWSSELQLGSAGPETDLSGQTRINVDYTTQWPPNTNADTWFITVTDARFVTSTNDGWLLRPEGIYFEVAGFSRPVDWSRIIQLEFTQNWDSLPNPLSYEVSRIYTVPEPCAMALLAGGLAWLAARRARRRV